MGNASKTWIAVARGLAYGAAAGIGIFAILFSTNSYVVSRLFDEPVARADAPSSGVTCGKGGCTGRTAFNGGGSRSCGGGGHDGASGCGPPN